MLGYDNWKLATPDDSEIVLADEGICDCSQPLLGGEGSLCSDCAHTRAFSPIVEEEH